MSILTPMQHPHGPTSCGQHHHAARAFLSAVLLATAATAFAAGPAFNIESPRNGSTITGPVTLTIAVTGAQIGTPMTGEDHLHVSIDGGPEQAIYHNRTFTLPLPPGQHTIAVQLAGPTHMPLLPDKAVTFTVQPKS